jgi:hypothetical protein
MTEINFGSNKVFHVMNQDWGMYSEKNTHFIAITPYHFNKMMGSILTEEEILIILEECRFRDVRELARGFLRDAILQNDPITEDKQISKVYSVDEEDAGKDCNIRIYVEKFEEFLFKNDTYIKEAYDLAVYYYDYLIERQKIKQSIKPKRDYVRKNYERLFVKIGKRDGFKCYACGSTDTLEIDHIHPVIKGGDNNDENLGFLCAVCNAKKHDKDLETFMAEQGFNR